MKLIDLTLPMYTGMPVYPGDLESSIELVQTLARDDWNMRRIQVNSHDGTHVNVPLHAFADGKSLDDYSLESFCGPAVVYDPAVGIIADKGIIFRDQNIDESLFAEIKKIRPRFVGLSSAFECDVDIERKLLKESIVLFERLTNLDMLPGSPVSFMFYGMPLKIKEGDGSPVRAFATVE
jgi:kynurenine formamidase